MKKSILLLFLSILLCSINIYAQKISDVNAYVSSDKIIIDYSINGAKFNESFHVYLLVSFDNGKSYDPMYEVQGDVGDGIKNGKHQIIWDALKERPFTDEELKFDVRATTIVKEIKRSFFVSYIANDMTPFGLRIGTIGKIGWYIEGRANLSPIDNFQYTFNKGDEVITDYDKAGYYEFTENEHYSALSVCAGITYQPSWNIFLYAGAGYGKEEYLMEIDDFSYENNSKTGQSLVKYSDQSITGIEIDAGVMYSFNKFLISGGITTINFEKIGWTAGVGIRF